MPALTVNVADDKPAAIVADAGTIKAVELAERPTTTPGGTAALDMVTEHVVLALAAMLVVAHCKELIVAAPSSDTVAVFDTPPYEAVKVTACDVVTVAAVAVKFAVVEPDATATAVGTIRFADPDVMFTVTPPDGAAALNTTLHVADAEELIEVGHATLVTDTGLPEVTAIFPAVPATASAVPEAVAPIVLLTPTANGVDVDANVAERVATTPLAMTLVLTPARIQI